MEGKVVGAMAERGLDQGEVSRRKAVVEVAAMAPVLKTKDEEVPVGDGAAAMAAAFATMDEPILVEETS
jgi:hypothetical protein